MLFLFAIIVAAILILAACVQLGIAVYSHLVFKRETVCRVDPEQQHPVAVLMCVRGCDPSLRASLISILNQQYEDYAVHLVVDHHRDAAFELVREVKREFDRNHRLTIHELRDPLSTCGLKCSSLVQGLAAVSSTTKYLALLDADVETHPTWLAELIGPLERDPTIGLVTGNQWFEPPAGSTWGALTRSTWNAGALVPTFLFKNPWAGTFAMRLEDVYRSGLSDVWKHSVIDDGPMRNAIDSLRLKIYFAPSLIMVNRENCTFRYVNRWVGRMLTWSRLYEPTFFLAVIHAIFSNTVMLANFAALTIGCTLANVSLIGVAAASLLISGVLSVLSYLTVRRIVTYSCQLRGESLPPITILRLAKLLLTVPIAQSVYGRSCLAALFSQTVLWREITYELKSKTDVKMVNYKPFSQTTEQAGSNVSI
jgi:glycosyltransferase involved in cell wall biosynthesis